MTDEDPFKSKAVVTVGYFLRLLRKSNDHLMDGLGTGFTKVRARFDRVEARVAALEERLKKSGGDG